MHYRYDVSFITINYNGLADTCEFVESIHKVVHGVTYEIVIVDNASSNNDATILKKKYPDVQVIASTSNLGFAGGNNLAIPHCNGKYLFFINNDTLIEKDCIRALAKRLEEDQRIGIVCPKICFAWDRKLIQYAGFTKLSSITLRNKSIGFGEHDEGQHDTAMPTYFAHGAAMMVRREAIEKARRMWEGYFLYYEEMDWSERIRNCGFEIWYDPIQTIYHKESRSVGIESPNKTYYLTRNRLIYARRNRKGVTKMLSIVYQTFVATFVKLPTYIVKGKFNNGTKILKALKDFYF